MVGIICRTAGGFRTTTQVIHPLNVSWVTYFQSQCLQINIEEKNHLLSLDCKIYAVINCKNSRGPVLRTKVISLINEKHITHARLNMFYCGEDVGDDSLCIIRFCALDAVTPLLVTDCTCSLFVLQLYICAAIQ